MISRRSVDIPSTDGRTLSGYAAVYREPSLPITVHANPRPYVEPIAPGAFGDSISGDVELLYNHDDSAVPLARTISGTLGFKSDGTGLRFEAKLPNTARADEIISALQRGDLTGAMSFGFHVEDDVWNRDRSERIVKRARIVEASLVKRAAYPQTHSSLRSVSEAVNDAARARLMLSLARLRNV